jgi:hypothetical protein
MDRIFAIHATLAAFDDTYCGSYYVSHPNRKHPDAAIIVCILIVQTYAPVNIGVGLKKNTNWYDIL